MSDISPSRERQWLLDEKYKGIETPDFFEDYTRLTAGEPLAYLIGHVPFLDATIFLDGRPLIPRAETEYWVEKAIEEIRGKGGEEPLTILDLCAGSGCIGVAILKAIPDAHVDFVEIDTVYHKTIAKNILENGIDPSRTRIYGGDLLEELPKKNQYDGILANPPYIDPEKIDRVEKDVLSYEPSIALLGGTFGMKYITRIISEASHYLKNSGVLYIEHEPEQTEAIHTLAQSLPYVSCTTYPDQWNKDRYTRLICS